MQLAGAYVFKGSRSFVRLGDPQYVQHQAAGRGLAGSLWADPLCGTVEADTIWTTGPSIGLAGATGILASADYALNRLRECHVAFPRDSRLERARALVQDTQDAGSLPADQTELGEATRTIFEMYWITRALGNATVPLGDALGRKLATVLAGPNAPDDETDRTVVARSTQFELFVGGWLAAGGVRVRHEEPDLVILFNDEWIGVAVKRVRSRRKLVQRTKRAIEQVERKTRTGMVALNVDRLLGRLKLSGASADHGAQFAAQVPELGQALSLVEGEARIKALLVLGFHFAWAQDHDRPRLDMSSFCKWQFFPNTDAEQAYMNQFQEEFSRVQSERLRRF